MTSSAGGGEPVAKPVEKSSRDGGGPSGGSVSTSPEDFSPVLMEEGAEGSTATPQSPVARPSAVLAAGAAVVDVPPVMASTNTHSTNNMSQSGSAVAVDSSFAAAGPQSRNEERAERSEIQHWRLQYKQCFDQLERERNAFADGIAKARKEAEKVFAEELELLREQVKAFLVDKEKRGTYLFYFCFIILCVLLMRPDSD